MLALISPAKRLDFERDTDGPTMTQPALWPESKLLLSELKKMSAPEVGALMKLSDKLADLNHQRFQTFPTNPKKALSGRPAVLAFDGDTYQGLDAVSLGEAELFYAQTHLCILSGLYGVLRAFDEIHPYRLEMGTKLKNQRGKDLYAFWESRITEQLQTYVDDSSSEWVCNLASTEYFKSVQPKGLSVPVVTPVFQEVKDDQAKVIGLMAKRARGMMARYIVENQVKSPDELKRFKVGGYKFKAKLSTETSLVFQRPRA